MQMLKKSTANQAVYVRLFADTDHITPDTTVGTPDSVKLSANGGALGSDIKGDVSWAHLGSGLYKMTLNATHTATVGVNALVVEATDADTAVCLFEVRENTEADLDALIDIVDGIVDAIKAKTDNLPASPAAVGSEMTLANDAITAAKFDESTAFPVTAADTGGTALARVGDAMTLSDDAITASKFDETTAFPLKSADTGSTQVFRTGADSDTGETISDQIDGLPAGVWAYSTRTITSGLLGAGADQVTMTLTVGGVALPDAELWVTSDAGGTTIVAGPYTTDDNGQCMFMLDDGVTYYLWGKKAGYNLPMGESFTASAD